MKKKLMSTGRRMAIAQSVCPDTKSFPDRMRSAKVSTVGRTAPKTMILPSVYAFIAFIVPVFVSFTCSSTKLKVQANCKLFLCERERDLMATYAPPAAQSVARLAATITQKLIQTHFVGIFSCSLSNK